MSSELSERHGMDLDVGVLRKCLVNLNFKVEIYSNCDTFAMQNLMREYALRRDHDQFDCFLCFVLSHGSRQMVYATDGEPLSIKGLIEPFKQCKSLLAKPKVFIIESCQVTERMKQRSRINLFSKSRNSFYDSKGDLTSPSMLLLDENSRKNSGEADMLIFQTTVEPIGSFRTLILGTKRINKRKYRPTSYFVESICNVLEKYAIKSNVEINVLLAKINDRITTKYSRPEAVIQSTLRKKFYFSNLNTGTAEDPVGMENTESFPLKSKDTFTNQNLSSLKNTYADSFALIQQVILLESNIYESCLNKN